MTVEELEQAGNWSNEDYFDYMKSSGNWSITEESGHTGNPCDRCGHDGLVSYMVDAWIDVKDSCTRSYSVVTAFEICLMCMFELYGSTQTDNNGRRLYHGYPE